MSESAFVSGPFFFVSNKMYICVKAEGDAAGSFNLSMITFYIFLSPA